MTSNPHPPPPVFGGRAWVPMAVEERRLETGLTHNSPLTPRVSCMLALRTSGRAGVGSGSQGVPGGRGPGGHGRACACAGWCQGALMGCMLMVVGSLVPMLRHFMLFESKLRDGLGLVERTGCITRQTAYASSNGRISSRRRDRSI